MSVKKPRKSNTNFTPKEKTGVIARYFDFLPIQKGEKFVSCNEGSTPLIQCKNLAKILEAEIWVKFEGLNPTGSFKDRGMCFAVSKSLKKGAHALVCASTGNTSASAAAYAARAGLQCLVILPAGKIAAGKLAQAFIYGAKVIAIDGNFDDALSIVRELGKRDGFDIVNSINPARIEGQKTAAFEIIEELGFVPDIHALPVGNAGNITAYWKGFQEAKDKEFFANAQSLPKLYGFQAEGAAPFVQDAFVAKPETVATAIRIGRPASWTQAKNARDESGGLIEAVSDEQIMTAQQKLASLEGIYAEPASCAPLAGLLKLKSEARLPKGVRISMTATGNGLKDTHASVERGNFQPLEAKADVDSVLALLEA